MAMFRCLNSNLGEDLNFIPRINTIGVNGASGSFNVSKSNCYIVIVADGWQMRGEAVWSPATMPSLSLSSNGKAIISMVGSELSSASNGQWYKWENLAMSFAKRATIFKIKNATTTETFSISVNVGGANFRGCFLTAIEI